MDDPLCRISIQCVDEARLVDLILPRHAHVGGLLPDIVGLVGRADTSGAPCGWRLDRILGGRCDESMSLHDSGITDGDVVVLSPVTAPEPGPLHQDLFRALADLPDDAPDDLDNEGTPRNLDRTAWGCAGLMAVLALSCSGLRSGTPVVTAGVALISAAACTIVASRHPRRRTDLHALVVLLLCIAGFFVTPGPPGAPGVVLGAAAGGVAAVWLWRAGSADTCALAAMATACALLTVATAAAMALSADLATLGAIMGVLALVGLGTAGRSAMALTGLRPASADGPDTVTPNSCAPHAVPGARTIVAGLVIGSAVSVGLACCVLAAAALRGAASDSQVWDSGPWPSEFALAVLFSALLWRRTRLYADLRCRVALAGCGLLGTAASVILVSISAPRYGGPAVVVAVAVAGWYQSTRDGHAPSWARLLDTVEYVLLAAVIPLACWVGGLYELVRSLSVG